MFSKAVLILSLISAAFATVYVTEPVETTIDMGGVPAMIKWQDDGNTPTLAQFGRSMISIYVGNEKQQTSLQLLNASVDVSQVTSTLFTAMRSIGPNGSHYFIRFQSLSLDPTVNGLAFSSQFTLTNMTGTFSSAILAQIAGQSTAPLAGQTSLSTGSPSTASLTTATASNNPSSTASTASTVPSATMKSSSAMGIKAGWAGVAFGALVGVTMF
jgi:hypothetical protein